MNKERELVLEDKNRDNSIENRKAIMVRATSLSYSPILLASFLAIYIGINFFGFGPARSAWLYLIFVVGVLATIFVSTTLFGPLSHLFFRLFSKVNLDKLTSKFKRKKRKKVVSTPRSAEPEERTFIGIND
jgi:ABC-type polysaccharide/polyol phosphate export permease